MARQSGIRFTMLLPPDTLNAIQAIANGEETPVAEVIRRAADCFATLDVGNVDLATSAPSDQSTARFVLYMSEYLHDLMAWKAQQRNLTIHEYAALACDHWIERKNHLYNSIANSTPAEATEPEAA